MSQKAGSLGGSPPRLDCRRLGRWACVHRGLVTGARSSQTTPRHLGWKKRHSFPIWEWSIAPAQLCGPSSRQLLSQLEHRDVPEQQKHSGN